jgi:hypothetical protein
MKLCQTSLADLIIPSLSFFPSITIVGRVKKVMNSKIALKIETIALIISNISIIIIAPLSFSTLILASASLVNLSIAASMANMKPKRTIGPM